MERAWKYKAWVAVFLLAFLTLGIWGAVFAEHRPGVLTVAVLAVGQGDSIYIESPTGVEILIDGGPGTAVLRELPKVMGIFDRSIDAVVATHPDADHIGGLIDLFERYRVQAYVEPGIFKETTTFERLEEEVDEAKIPRYLARRGMELELGGGAVLKVLFPDSDVSNLSSDEANEGGVVVQLIYGSSTMLFMADVPQAIEGYLVAVDGEALDSDILKVGHHGSRTSTSDTFVSYVSPEYAVISVGEDNRYGHPTSDVLQTLADQNVKTLRTDLEGTIIFQSNGGEFVRSK